jgi:hypothetical protein
MRRRQWLLGKFRFNYWILLLLFAAAIDYFSLTNNLFQFTDLVTINSILVAAAGIMYQVQAANEREIASRTHQQKRETYIQLLDFIAKFFDNMDKQGAIVDPTTIVSKREYYDLCFKLSTFASKDVIIIFNKFLHPDISFFRENKGNWAVIQFGNLFKQMRKEVGFQEGDVTARELLSLWMTDAYESKYDELFRKLN